METFNILAGWLPAFIDFCRRLLAFIGQSRDWGHSKGITAHLRYWRKFVVSITAIINWRQIAPLLELLDATPLRRDMAAVNPCILEQAVRPWFYYGSVMQERIALLQDTILFLETALSPEALRKIYTGDGILLWRQQVDNAELSLLLHFQRQHRKEGLLSVTLTLGEKRLYLISFWIAAGATGEPALWIGALQGKRGGEDEIRALTKSFFGYRPKNLIFYAVRMVARQLKIGTLYAVSNYGFQASHHIRSQRRLKTSLDEFWQETGGVLCQDSRFFQLPLTERRKQLQDVKTHKRNLYRQRFALLDTVAAGITAVMQRYVQAGRGKTGRA